MPREFRHTHHTHTHFYKSQGFILVLECKNCLRHVWNSTILFCVQYCAAHFIISSNMKCEKLLRSKFVSSCSVVIVVWHNYCNCHCLFHRILLLSQLLWKELFNTVLWNKQATDRTNENNNNNHIHTHPRKKQLYWHWDAIALWWCYNFDEVLTWLLIPGGIYY